MRTFLMVVGFVTMCGAVGMSLFVLCYVLYSEWKREQAAKRELAEAIRQRGKWKVEMAKLWEINDQEPELGN